MTDAEGLSPKFMMGSLWSVAGEGRGLLYAKRAISVKPTRRKVRSAAAVVSGGKRHDQKVDRALRTSFHNMGICIPVC